MFCNKCGNPVGTDDKYCGKCGNKLKKSNLDLVSGLRDQIKPVVFKRFILIALMLIAGYFVISGISKGVPVIGLDKGEKTASINPTTNSTSTIANISSTIANISSTVAKVETLVKNTEDVVITKISNKKDSIGSDVVNLTIKNNTDKVLKTVLVGILGYDSNGYPIKLEFGSADEFLGRAENINLQPGESNEYGWTVYAQEDNLAKAKAAIIKFEFYGSDEQTNEYHNVWLEENLGKQY